MKHLLDEFDDVYLKKKEAERFRDTYLAAASAKGISDRMRIKNQAIADQYGNYVAELDARLNDLLVLMGERLRPIISASSKKVHKPQHGKKTP